MYCYSQASDRVTFVEGWSPPQPDYDSIKTVQDMLMTATGIYQAAIDDYFGVMVQRCPDDDMNITDPQTWDPQINMSTFHHLHKFGRPATYPGLSMHKCATATVTYHRSNLDVPDLDNPQTKSLLERIRQKQDYIAYVLSGFVPALHVKRWTQLGHPEYDPMQYHSGNRQMPIVFNLVCLLYTSPSPRD